MPGFCRPRSVGADSMSGQCVDRVSTLQKVKHAGQTLGAAPSLFGDVAQRQIGLGIESKLKILDLSLAKRPYTSHLKTHAHLDSLSSS